MTKPLPKQSVWVAKLIFKEQKMQALINLAVVLAPIWLMGLAIIIKGEF